MHRSQRPKHFRAGDSSSLFARKSAPSWAALTRLPEPATLLIAALFRPGRDDLSWRFHELAQRVYGERYTPVELLPLDAIHSRQLVDNLLQVTDEVPFSALPQQVQGEK